MAEYAAASQQQERQSAFPSVVTQRKKQRLQFEDNRPNRLVQRQPDSALNAIPNNTGLPNNLKSGMENLSGMSLDHVRVHRNSDKPAAVQAHAYAQGADIHLASGQEHHLPHELGHVVQQAQGLVKPTTSVGGMAVNDNAGLESHATALGNKALQRASVGGSLSSLNCGWVQTSFNAPNAVIQEKTDIKQDSKDGNDTETSSKEIATPTQGTKWFRFNKNGQSINSFSNNIYKGPNAGSNPVEAAVEIGAKADAEGNFGQGELGTKSRAIHFGLGDRIIGKDKGYRKGKLTWHHQDNHYHMQLVDMYVHGGFGHTGGYSGWQDDTSSDGNVD
ncbi:MAG: hypothetical protein ACI8WB_000068 [Phenylobacterium sp.]|jgi:hypothetical protein